MTSITENRQAGEQRSKASMTPGDGTAPALLIASGWKEDLSAYRDLVADLTEAGWRTATVALPQESDERQTRRQHLALLEAAADDLFAGATRATSSPGLRCLLGFSYGGYMGVLLSRTRHLDAMILRSPAIYGDSGWDVAKDDLDEQNIAILRKEDLRPSDNLALAAASEFTGRVALFECELDKVVPHQTHANYYKAFSARQACEWDLLRGADHALEDRTLRKVFFRRASSWLKALQGRV